MTTTESLAVVVDMLRDIYGAGALRGSRSYTDMFRDRLMRSGTETLAMTLEHLMRAMQASTDGIRADVAGRVIGIAHGPDAATILAWLRDHVGLAAMLASIRDEAIVREALAEITLTPVTESGIAVPAGTFDVPITVTCLSPLAHGADGKAGNATLFRRMRVLATNESLLTLPYYAGNAVRGQMRDLLADHFIKALGIKPSLWFFYALYSGGPLEEKSAALSAMLKKLGDHGSIRTAGLREFRQRIAPLSLLGCALGNRTIAGRVYVGGLRPDCREWGTGDVPAASLMTWEFATRREDLEGHAENHSMITDTECLKVGVVLRGGFSWAGATPLEQSCLGLGLRLLTERGAIGGENRRGHGRVAITTEHAPDPQPYLDALAQDEELIRGYLTGVGAIES